MGIEIGNIEMEIGGVKKKRREQVEAGERREE
jgi:hypothetical protein